ncbi:MAG: hypothetical protein O3A47_03110 [Chloroflexi bacterium]|nr:hypothetical protein [Chloroflexota bacterium]
MAILSINVPDDYEATVVAALREEFPNETSGLSNPDASSAGLKQLLRGVVAKYALRHADTQAVRDAQAAADAAEASRRTAARARKDAEKAAADNVELRFQEVS